MRIDLIFQKNPVHRLLTIAIARAVVWYITLCFLHFLSSRPLWNDEKCVFLSIQFFSPKEIFSKVLLAIQVFPRLYLLLIQQFSQQFNFSLQALRFPSFVCMLLIFGSWRTWAHYARQDPPERQQWLAAPRTL